MSKRLVPIIICMVGLTIPAGSAEASSDAVSVMAEPHVTVGGRTYGPAEGLEVQSGEIELTGTGNGAVAASQLEAATLAGKTYTWGSSYASTTERVQLRYTGRAFAAANVYGGKRIIQVCFKYRRDGRDVSPRKCSQASSATGKWVSGRVASYSIWDTLDPFAAKTTFSYSTSRIDPRVL